MCCADAEYNHLIQWKQNLRVADLQSEPKNPKAIFLKTFCVLFEW